MPETTTLATPQELLSQSICEVHDHLWKITSIIVEEFGNTFFGRMCCWEDMKQAKVLITEQCVSCKKTRQRKDVGRKCVNPDCYYFISAS